MELEMNNQVVEDFLQEAIIMGQFNHPNVLSLIGVSTNNDKPSVVMPLMRNGDLKKYLNANISVCIIFRFNDKNNDKQILKKGSIYLLRNSN